MNGKDGIHILLGPDGRLKGEAVIELESREDLDKAKQLNNQMMGRRYIEITIVSRAQADHALSNQPGVSSVRISVCWPTYMYVYIDHHVGVSPGGLVYSVVTATYMCK